MQPIVKRISDSPVRTAIQHQLEAKSKNPHMGAAIAANCTEPLTLGGVVRLVPARSKLCSPFDDVCKNSIPAFWHRAYLIRLSHGH